MARASITIVLLLAAVASCLLAFGACDGGADAAVRQAADMAEAEVAVDGSAPATVAAGDATQVDDEAAVAVDDGTAVGTDADAGTDAGAGATERDAPTRETEAVRVLTEELAEVERALDLTRQKADVLRRLRAELLFGGKLPDRAPGFAARRASAVGSGLGAAAGGDAQDAVAFPPFQNAGREQYGDAQQSRGGRVRAAACCVLACTPGVRHCSRVCNAWCVGAARCGLDYSTAGVGSATTSCKKRT